MDGWLAITRDTDALAPCVLNPLKNCLGAALRVAPTRLIAFPLEDGPAALPVAGERWAIQGAAREP